MTKGVGQNVSLLPDEAKRLGLTLDDIQSMYIVHAEDPNFPESCMPLPNETQTQYAQFIVYIFLPPIYRNVANTARVFYAEEAHLIGANELQRALIEAKGEKVSITYSRMLENARENRWRDRVKDYDYWKQRMVLHSIAAIQMEAPLKAFATLINGLDDKMGANRIRAAEALLNRSGFPALSEKSITHNREVKSAGELTDDELKFEILKRLSGSAIENQPLAPMLTVEPVTEAIKPLGDKPLGAQVNIVTEALKDDLINGDAC